MPSRTPVGAHILPPQGRADYATLARLEADVFAHDPISVVAFGPDRASESVLAGRAEGLMRANGDGKKDGEKREDGCVFRLRKAVISKGDGELIVGWAYWKFLDGAVVEADEGDGGLDGYGDGDGDGGEAELANRCAPTSSTPIQWPEGANVELCEAVFGESDRLRERSMKGQRHAILNILVVRPDYQGRGIGSLLIRDGLEEADRLAVPVWLGATEQALPLYEKFGFQVDKRMEFDLSSCGWDAIEKHTIMIRPAMAKVERAANGIVRQRATEMGK